MDGDICRLTVLSLKSLLLRSRRNISEEFYKDFELEKTSKYRGYDGPVKEPMFEEF